MALKNNTWKLNQWYDQDVAGNVSYSGVLEGWLWGYNQNGYLGQNDKTTRSSPVQIPGSWDRIQGTIGIKNDGTAWAWGINTRGTLGQNNRTAYSSPIQIGSGTDWYRSGFLFEWVGTGTILQ